MGSQSAPVPSGALAVYRFEGFTLDLARGCLYNESDQVKLRPKSFEALRYIVERSGRLVSKDELNSAVWPDLFVSDNSLAQCFLEIRRALQDDDQRIIKTVSRRGYIFNVPVERVLAHPLPGRAPGPGTDAADAPSPVPASSPARRPTGRIQGLAPGTALLVVAVASAIWFGRSRPAPPSAPVSMAVLPFQSLVQSEPDEFLELGLADALITRLSNLRELVVRPTSAVRVYTDRKRDAVGIGKLLKVSYVVDGSVQQKAGRIRVSIQLIGMPDGRPLWAERYDERSDDIFAVQDAISTKVASSLQLQLAREETSSLQRKATSDPEAFRSYLRGVYFLERRTKDDLSKALEYFNDAIHRDPGFALAYAGAAKCYAPSIFLEVRQGGPTTLAEMRHLIDRALELDPNMADAFVSQGALRSLEWDWTGSEQSYRKAIALNPNDVLARVWYGFFLDAMGREEENLAQRKRALELDPLGWNANAGVGNALGALGRHDEAIKHLRAAVELNPTYFFVRQNLGKEYLAIGKPDLAIPEFQAVQDLPSLGYAYARNGQRAEAQRVLEEMRQNPMTTSFDVAIVDTGLGRTAEALDRLEQAFRERTPWLMFIRVDLRLASLRGNPRFESIAAAMKIPRS
jgi:TolB-like protein/DNA-binding winged helix-turn-helix (wHTH) protein/tetratricopeptide (TPR) repeat protein